MNFEDHTRSYDPYLISYHHDSNTFTYNDPWINNNKDQSNNSNNNCNDISNEYVCDNNDCTTNESQHTSETPQYVHNDWQSDNIEQNYHSPHVPVEISTPAFTACDTINNHECHEQQQQQSNSVDYHNNQIRCDDVSPSSSNLNNVRNVEHVSHEVSSP